PYPLSQLPRFVRGLARTRSGGLAQNGAHANERKTEEIAPAPRKRISSCLVVASQSDSPNGVHRARLDEDVFARAQQIRTQAGILSELGGVAAHDDVHSHLAPDLVVEGAHLAADRLALPWLFGRKDGTSRFDVTERARLLGHHELLGTGI